MRVGLAGAGGFIGRRLAPALGADGHDVVGFGREGLTPGQTLDALVWAAGGRRGSAAELEAVHAHAPLEALAALAHAPARVVYLSSGEVYGVQPVPFREDAPARGESPYARAKLSGERMLTEACGNAGTALFVLRPAVVYGPGQHGSMLIPSLIHALGSGQPLDLTPGAQTRDFLHVNDLVRLVARCLEPDAAPGVYNAGTGVETSVLALAQRLAHLGGPDRERLLRPGALPYRNGEQMRYALDPTRALERLGFRTEVDLAAGLAKLVASTPTADSEN